MSMRSRSRFIIAALLVTVGASAYAAGYVPPEALDTPASNVSDAMTAFGTKVQSDTLAGYRRAAREDLMRADIRDFVRGADWSTDHLRESLSAPNVILCKPHYGYLRIAVPLENTSAEAAAIKSILQAPSSDVPTLLKAFTTKYTIDPTITTIAADYDTWLKSPSQGAPCATAMAGADPFKTRGYIGNEIGFIAAAEAGEAVFDAVWGVIKPAVTGVLQNADLERRNNIVKEYFADPANVTALKADLEHVETFLGNEFTFAQAKTAGAAVAAVKLAENPNGASWKAAFVVMKSASCKDKFAKLNDDKTDPDGVACLTSVYAAFDPAIKSALDAGDAFDASLDKRLPAKPLSKQIDTVAAIARGEQPAEDKLKALWGTLVRYATLFNTVKDTASAANQKKINDAIDAFTKALK